MELCNLCSENSSTDQLSGYAHLICAFVVAYAKHMFSHVAAYIYAFDILSTFKH